MRRQVDSLDFWSSLLIGGGCLAVLATLIAGLNVISQHTSVGIGLLIGGLVSAVPLFALAAICRALAALIRSSEHEQQLERDRLAVEARFGDGTRRPASR